jgi:carbon monoxide dehydrogenase subunit G
MLLKVSEELNLDASQDEVWKLLRDTPRLAALLPGVESVTPLDEPGAEAYQAKASDKIGPFKVSLSLEIRVTEAREPVSLKAGIKGSDSIGLNRITGSLHITLVPASPSAQLRFEADIEILGKLATLGAAPIRRRVTDKFAEFARNIQAQFAPAVSPNLRVQSATDVRAGLRTQSTTDVRASLRTQSKKDRR